MGATYVAPHDTHGPPPPPAHTVLACVDEAPSLRPGIDFAPPRQQRVLRETPVTVPRIVQTRGGSIESEHPASVVAVRDNTVLWRAGDDRESTFRSASKPFQLACALAALDDPPLPPTWLAVGAASHSAEPVHVTLVTDILRHFELSPSGLRCGAHPPLHGPSAEAILRAGGRFTELHNNCSGKHAFMLAAARHQSWDEDYLPITHPLQRRIMEQLGAWMQHTPTHAIDGCGVPTFVQPLSAMARAWSRVAEAMDDLAKGRPLDPWQARLGRIGEAMAAHPELTSGTGRLDLDVLRSAREPMAVKIGAMGVFCIALPTRRIGIAMKVHSGTADALPALVSWALAEVAPDAWCEPEAWALRAVRNVVGRPVGSWKVLV